jgi:N-acetylmuramoyl-L-alanine amidase
MKKNTLLIIAMIVLIMALPSYGARNYESDTISLIDDVTKEAYEVRTVNIMMSGQDVISDVPAVIFKDRTLVPLRIITESLGADVSWNQETKEATVTTDDKTIVIEIDSSMVLVNGVKKSLPYEIPAKLLNYGGFPRTLVPLRFMSEELGMDVEWIEDTYTATINKPAQSITGFSFDSTRKFPELHIKSTGEIETNSYILEGSSVGDRDKLVIDIPNANFAVTDPSLLIGTNQAELDIYEDGIIRVRASQFDTNPLVTRLVVDMNDTRGYETEYNASSKTTTFRFVNSVEDIRVEKIYSAEAVIIETGELPAIAKTMALENPKRYVIDIINCRFPSGFEKQEIDAEGIRNVRASQYDATADYGPDEAVSRIVVDLEESIAFENIYFEIVDEKDLYVYVSGNPLEGIDYMKEDINLATLTINTQESGSHSISYNSSNRTITVKVPKSILSLDSLVLPIEDTLIETIDIDASRSSYNYFYIKLAKNVEYKDESASGLTDKIILAFENKAIKNSIHTNTLIVLDAGHGGKDPGATSPTYGLREKDVVLDVTKKLAKLLEREGFKVYLTRDSDNYVGLYNRAEIANELDADAFVSIHANAHSRTAVSGVEVLYCPDSTGRDSKSFARVMQDALIDELGAVNRGIVSRPNLVVIRETEMPAVLAEIGFLTHIEKEEKLLNTSAYRDKCAEALYEGLMDYFK